MQKIIVLLTFICSLSATAQVASTIDIVTDGIKQNELNVTALEEQFLKVDDKQRRYRLALILSHYTQDLKQSDPIYVLKNALKALSGDQKEKYRLLRLLADWYFQKGQLEQAEKTFSENIKENPLNPENMYLSYKLGWVFVNKEQPLKALEIWSKSLLSDSGSTASQTLAPVIKKDYGKILAESFQKPIAKQLQIPSPLLKSKELYVGMRAGLTRSSWVPTKTLLSNMSKSQTLNEFVYHSIQDKAFFLPEQCHILDWFRGITTINLDANSLKYLNTPLKKCLDKNPKSHKTIQELVTNKIKVNESDYFLFARTLYQLKDSRYCNYLEKALFTEKDKGKLTSAINTLSKNCDHQKTIRQNLAKFVYQVPVDFENKLPLLLHSKNIQTTEKNFEKFALSKNNKQLLTFAIINQYPKIGIRILRRKKDFTSQLEMWNKYLVGHEKILTYHEKLELYHLNLTQENTPQIALEKSLLFLIKEDPESVAGNWGKYEKVINSNSILKEEYFISGLKAVNSEQQELLLKSPSLLNVKRQLLNGSLNREHLQFSKKTQRNLNQFSALIRQLNKEAKYLNTCNCPNKVQSKQWLTKKYYQMKKIKNSIDKQSYLHEDLALTPKSEFNQILEKYEKLFEETNLNKTPLIETFMQVFKKWRYTI